MFLKAMAASAAMPAALSGCRSAASRAGAVAKRCEPEYHAFSRVFQFIKDPYRAADFIKSCGYDGVEWTVRPGGFCEPDNAVRGLRDLKAAADKAGLKADNLVVSFIRGDDPGAEAIAKAGADAGFASFRGG